MCSVVGYVGSQSNKEVVLHGLLQLEYRGYDSAGYATLVSGTDMLQVTKVVGSVAALQKALAAQTTFGTVGIGHTRWSTHGISSVANAHPHLDCSGTLAIVHNGIIENSASLRAALKERGHVLQSDTDSELIAHLLEDALKKQTDPLAALRVVAQQLDGAYACVIISVRYPDQILWLRSRSPLCVTITEHGAAIASDPGAFKDTHSPVCYLPDNAVGIVTPTQVSISVYDGTCITPVWHARNQQPTAQHNGALMMPHAMLSEIFEQKMVIERTVRTIVRDGISDSLRSLLQKTETVTLIGCGTSYHAGQIGRLLFRSIAQVATATNLASEYLYEPWLSQSDELCIGISQSGETADTLEALRRVKEHAIPTIALTNTQQSTMAREVDIALYTHAGVERAVASTKAFTTQVSVLYWLAHEMAYQKGTISAQERERAVTDLCHAAALLEEAIMQNKLHIDTVLAPLYARAPHAIFLGRQMGYAVACEAALKLKEISYIFTTAYPAGELKHGPLALIESTVPVFLISSHDPILYKKLVSNAHEIKARGGHLCAILFAGQTELANLADHIITIPTTSELLMPIALMGVVQYLCYAIARELGRPIDKPRNLAKSVTVE